jgi:hypothetical protein
MEIIRPSNLSVVFLSFEEPDKENNWSHLKERVDHAVRVDGVKGFDAAHKAAAAAAETERFVLVDGDALVYDTFWDLNIRIPTKYQDGVLSFCARNVVNELSYGYGGLKIWTKDFINRMRTHEASESFHTAFEFCWLPNYFHFASEWNETHINGSPEQAFRAGFRETAKLMAPEGVLTHFESLLWSTKRKLVQWMTLGMDAPNGHWAIAGAHTAFSLLQEGEMSPSLVNDYDTATEHFERIINDENISITDPEFHWWTPPEFRPLDFRISRMVKTYIKTKRKATLNPLEPCQPDTE